MLQSNCCMTAQTCISGLPAWTAVAAEPVRTSVYTLYAGKLDGVPCDIREGSNIAARSWKLYGQLQQSYA